MDGISTIFGPRHAEAVDRIAQGQRKAEIAKACGAVVGPCEVSFGVTEGENLTLMGLSGSDEGLDWLAEHGSWLTCAVSRTVSDWIDALTAGLVAVPP